MNKQRIAERFGRAAATYEQEATVQRQIAATMMDHLRGHVATPHPRVFEFGCGTGLYSRLLHEQLSPARLYLNDLSPKMGEACQDLLQASDKVSFVAADAETLPLPEGIDIVTSCSAIQWFEQPEAFFARCADALPTGGLLAFSTFGKENMHEIHRLIGKGLLYRALSELTEALSTQYEVWHASEEQVKLSFPTPQAVLYHLKQTGVNTPTGGGETPSRPWTKGDLLAFAEAYRRLFPSEQGVSLTYHPLYIIAKKKNV